MIRILFPFHLYSHLNFLSPFFSSLYVCLSACVCLSVFLSHSHSSFLCVTLSFFSPCLFLWDCFSLSVALCINALRQNEILQNPLNSSVIELQIHFISFSNNEQTCLLLWFRCRMCTFRTVSVLVHPDFKLCFFQQQGQQLWVPCFRLMY